MYTTFHGKISPESAGRILSRGSCVQELAQFRHTSLKYQTKELRSLAQLQQAVTNAPGGGWIDCVLQV